MKTKKTKEEKDIALSENKELNSSKITHSAKVRKRSVDGAKRGSLIFSLSVCLFAMIFVIVILNRKTETDKVIILDGAGQTYDGDVKSFEDSKQFHQHLLSMAVGGIYARDENGQMNNNLQIISNLKMRKKRDAMYDGQDRVFKQKRIVQFPRIVGYQVDVVSESLCIIKAKVQVIREAFTIAGGEIKGVENVNLLLRFEKNLDIGQNYFKPWVLVDFKEVILNEEGQ